jgi:protein TonB
VKPPKGLQQPAPPYTQAARDARIEGILLVSAVIQKDGSVGQFKVMRGLGYGLDESAIDTIAKRWKFQPGTLNGQPVKVSVVMEVSFRLY